MTTTQRSNFLIRIQSKSNLAHLRANHLGIARHACEIMAPKALVAIVWRGKEGALEDSRYKIVDPL